MVEFVNTLKGFMNPDVLVENVYVFSVLCIFLSMYGPRLHIRLPPTLMGLFNNTLFRAAVLFLIAYMSHKDFVGALAITIIFMVSLNILHTHTVLSSAATSISKPASKIASNTTNNLVNVLNNTVDNSLALANNTVTGTKNVVKTTANDLTNVVGSTVTDMSAIVTAESENAANAIGDIANVVGNTIGGVANVAGSTINNVAGVMSSTIGGAAGVVGDTIGDVSGFINNTFSDIGEILDTGVSGAAQDNNEMQNTLVATQEEPPVSEEEGFRSNRIEQFAMRSHHPNTHLGSNQTEERALSGPSANNDSGVGNGKPLSSCGAYHDNNSNATGTVQYPLNGESNNLQGSNYNNPYGLV